MNKFECWKIITKRGDGPRKRASLLIEKPKSLATSWYQIIGKLHTNLSMLNVNIEVISWLKEDFGHEGSDRLFIKETVPEGCTIMNLLCKLAKKYPVFAKKAFKTAGR